ncbi:MAG: DUF5107 domain-containing protein [Muribaculaceae bacterium]|nr:DUF5107 domain-containing protein [Muribaculaceae bacterium]
MVKAWNERVTIPTYEVGKPDKNPIFLEKRVYQGSSGAVYPYQVIESISDTKTDVEYEAIFLENEYLKIMILPQLGGRIQMAYDKIADRHFIYYNHVIKPALVGLAGPWISGGIEFNWPQHHRPSTFMPVDSLIERHSDGSATVWVNETERMFHQKGRAGMTLRPGCAYLEIEGVLYNPTPLPQTFLWWANPAVAVNDHYRSIFPGDINAVFDHGKRAVSSFPIATGTYYKMDYSSGVDIANYKNIFVPTSYMGVNSRYDFEGGYECDTRAGMLHVANHHVSPGKKQWTWGNGDFGRAWDRNLTDDDGPYIELMAGVFTENQPDFSWLMPYEEKEFKQYFLPYREIGAVKNASKDLLLNIEEAPDGHADLKIFATSRMTIVATVYSHGDVIFEKELTLSPEQTVCEPVELPAGASVSENISVRLSSGTRTLLTWEPEPDEICPVPESAEAALLPEEIKTCEQLYLTGLHLEQYRHATFSPTDYYEEALRRDPDDVRCNNALGLWYIRKGRFDKAEGYLRRAVRIIRRRNPNPYDGEPLYNLAIALLYQGRLAEAYDLFYKSTWNAAWQDAGFLSCARISSIMGNTGDALYETSRALARNWHNHQARALRCALLLTDGKPEAARRLAEESIAIEPFNYCAMFVDYVASGDAATLEKMKTLMRGDASTYDEVAIEFMNDGLFDFAIRIWSVAREEGAVTPMTWYYSGLCHLLAGQLSEADAAFVRGAEADPEGCFPNRLEAVTALTTAIDRNPYDGMARYYLGNLYYDKRQSDCAIPLWEEAARLCPDFPTVWRNLALAYYNKRNDQEKALACMERAYSLDESDARVLMELDQLYRQLLYPHERRLEFLSLHSDVVAQRDDLTLEYITLLNLTGRYREAMEMLDARIFHPWEGGEGKVPAQYQAARVGLARQAMRQANYDEALTLLNECLDYPHHLGEGKLYGAQENDFYYLLGNVYAALGRIETAKECWKKATAGPTEPAPALYYNDAKPDKIFYAGLAYRALGDEAKARSYFNRLADYGRQHYHDHVTMDYFAVSLPDLLIWDSSLDTRNRVHCLYMLALGCAGLGDAAHARSYLDRAAALDPNHQGIISVKPLIFDEIL